MKHHLTIRSTGSPINPAPGDPHRYGEMNASCDAFDFRFSCPCRVRADLERGVGVSERCGECDSDRYNHCCRTMDRAAGLEPAPGAIPGVLVGTVLSASRKCSNRGLVYDIFQDTASVRPLNNEHHSGCTNDPSNHRNRGTAVSSGDVPVA